MKHWSRRMAGLLLAFGALAVAAAMAVFAPSSAGHNAVLAGGTCNTTLTWPHTAGSVDIIVVNDPTGCDPWDWLVLNQGGSTQECRQLDHLDGGGLGNDNLFLTPALAFDHSAGETVVEVAECPALGASPTPSPTSTPTPAASWGHTCYVGAEQPIEQAMANIDVQAVYRLNSSQAFDRWFPGRPELSTITTISPYQPLLILMPAGATLSGHAFGGSVPPGSGVTLVQPPGSVSLHQGWNSVCYAGQTESPVDATAGIAGAFSILYRLGSDQTWSRYVPGRPEVSNIAELAQDDALLLLVTAEGGVQWVFNP